MDVRIHPLDGLFNTRSKLNRALIIGSRTVGAASAVPTIGCNKAIGTRMVETMIKAVIKPVP